MYKFKSTFLFTMIFLAGASAFAQEHQHTNHLSTLIEHYMNAKDALAEDDFDEADSSLIEFRKEVIENNDMNHHEEHTQMHAKHHGSMVEAVTKAVQADDLDSLRAAFKDISNNLIKAVKNQDYDSKKLHLQYCPMADDGVGGQWISDQEAIVNPYMGQKMPSVEKQKK